MARSIRQGFTLIEMLVVIAIIGILASMLLPAVQYAREMGRRSACDQNMQQMGKACIMFANIDNGRFPGWRERVGKYTDQTTMMQVEPALPWTVAILPQLDQRNTYDEYAAGKSPNLRYPFMICLSDGDKLTGNVISFVINAGRAPTDVNLNPAAEHYSHGIAHNYYDTRMRTRLEDIKDGAGSTLLLTENNAARGWDINLADTMVPTTIKKGRLEVVWFETNTNSSSGTPIIVRRINEQRDSGMDANRSRARPSSYHTLGVNMVFADGHSAFVNESINYGIYMRLLTTDYKTSDQLAGITTGIASEGKDY